MSQYVVSITNGAGSQNLPAGNYDVSAAVTGYNGVLDPDAFTATTSTGSQAFTIEATGALTLNINETGASGGAPITGGTFIRCNQAGTQNYGTAKTVSALGVCSFSNVPYGTALAPYTLYVKQLTSDESHSIHSGVISIDMEAATQSNYVQNLPAALQSFTFTDANYAGLNISGSLTFDGPQ